MIGLVSGTLMHAQGPLAFDVASVRPTDPGGLPPSVSRAVSDRFPACGGYSLQIDPARFMATNVTLYKLITWAYRIRYSCYIVNDGHLLSGEPKWALTDRFDIQATIPVGTPAYTPQQLQDGAAPDLQAMLLSLLTERFKVAVHRDTKEMSVYELTLATRGPKLAAPDGDKPKRETMRLDPDENKENVVHLLGNKASTADLAHLIEPVTNTPVLDRTGLTDEYRFDVKFAVLDPSGGQIGNIPWATGPSIFTVLQGQLGLKLTPTRGPVDVWVIDRAEKPSGN